MLKTHYGVNIVFLLPTNSSLPFKTNSDPMTALLAFNEVDLSLEWNSIFDGNETIQPFFTHDKTVQYSRYLNGVKLCGHKTLLLNNNKIDIIKIHCSHNLEMLLISTQRKGHVGLVLSQFDLINVTSLLAEDYSAKWFNITLPVIDIQSNVNFIDVFRKIGIQHLFQKNVADLSGINGGHDLYVSSLTQSNHLNWNSRGVDATSVTYLKVGLAAKHVVTDRVYDHPFTFIITQSSSNIILYVGNVMHGNKSITRDDEAESDSVSRVAIDLYVILICFVLSLLQHQKFN